MTCCTTMLQWGHETMSHRRSFIAAGLAAGAAAATLASTVQEARAQQASKILGDIQSRGALRMATVAGNPPYSSFKPDGTPEGYDIDIGNEFAAALKVKPNWFVVDTPGRIASLQTGKADITVANFTNTIERSTAIAFTRPYVIVGSNYVVKKESPLQTVAALNNPQHKVGVPRGGTGEIICQANTPNAEMVRFNTVNDIFLALNSGQIDAQIMDSLQDSRSWRRKARTSATCRATTLTRRLPSACQPATGTVPDRRCVRPPIGRLRRGCEAVQEVVRLRSAADLG